MSSPELITSIPAMRDACSNAKRRGTLGFVPTMGALHAGHLSLVRAAKELCHTVAVSIFVNPAQFGPEEDFTRYPRALEADIDLVKRENVGLLFVPSVGEMYPNAKPSTKVEVPEIGNRLDGRYRPGHFLGVATVVAKLFHIVSPDTAFFGQKDAAQVAVLRAMVRDLNFPLSLKICPTVREPDGLAMSSRNRYLTSDERVQARVLYRALCDADSMVASGTRDVAELRRAMLRAIESEPAVRIEYAEVVEPDTLLPLRNISGGALLAIAAWVGGTRLIDNLLLPPTEGSV